MRTNFWNDIKFSNIKTKTYRKRGMLGRNNKALLKELKKYVNKIWQNKKR